LLSILFIGLVALAVKTHATTNTNNLAGKSAPEFALADTDGENISLSSLNNRPILLLIADDSESSQEHLSQISEMYDHYSASELKIVPIVSGVDQSRASEIQDDLWLPYQIYGDPSGEIAKLYGIEKFPQAVIIDNGHIIRYVGDYTGKDDMTKRLFKWMDEKVFMITARQWEYEPNIIEVNKGDRVLIQLRSEDVTHGMYIDGYEKFVTAYRDVNGELITGEADHENHHIQPGMLGVAKFTADKGGRFDIRCASTCGPFHPYMKGRLKVAPNTIYHMSLFLTALVSIFSIYLFSKEKNRTRILGLMPMEWRFDLTQYSIVRKLTKSRWVPFIFILTNIFFFTVILVADYTGGVSAGNYNFGIMFVWILWYALLMIVLVPVFSRVWCMTCPLPFFGDWFQRSGLLKVRSKLLGLNKKFPKALRNMWLVNIIFIGTTYANGYLTTRPIASFIMYAIIIVLATVTGMVYEKRTFCLYICPVGGFQGLYSNMAMTEIRAKDKEICKNHKQKTCYIGNEDGYGCPWLLTPFNLDRNTYCGMCLECFKTCPYDNMVINLRPPGVDVLVDNKRGLDESWKSFIMIGCAIVFFVFMNGPWGALKGWQNANTWSGYAKYVLSHSIFTLLILPFSYGVFVYISKAISGVKDISYKKLFVNYSYCTLPLGLMLWIAFSLGFLLPNGSYLIHVASDPFAWGWNLFGTAGFQWTPFLTWLLPYLQVASLLFGLAFSIDLGIKLSRQMFENKKEAMVNFLPIGLYLGLFTALLINMFLG
ncbi:MAG: redoxin domain-containing protein, partial [Nitrospinota bacterium]